MLRPLALQGVSEESMRWFFFFFFCSLDYSLSETFLRGLSDSCDSGGHWLNRTTPEESELDPHVAVISKQMLIKSGNLS